MILRFLDVNCYIELSKSNSFKLSILSLNTYKQYLANNNYYALFYRYSENYQFILLGIIYNCKI